MFNDDKGICIVTLKVTWSPQDREYIPQSPNEAGIYLQIALYYGKEKLFIPGNSHGYGFSLTKENIQHFRNPLNPLNDHPIYSPKKLRGLHPIPGCGLAS